MRTYVVQRGDSPASIAARFAGCPKCAVDLVRANPQKPWRTFPNGFLTFQSLHVGERLNLPDKWFNGMLDRLPASYFAALPSADGGLLGQLNPADVTQTATGGSAFGPGAIAAVRQELTQGHQYVVTFTNSNPVGYDAGIMTDVVSRWVGYPLPDARFAQTDDRTATVTFTAPTTESVPAFRSSDPSQQVSVRDATAAGGGGKGMGGIVAGLALAAAAAVAVVVVAQAR